MTSSEENQLYYTIKPKILIYLRLRNVKRLICAKLNINSLTNKFDWLDAVVNNNINILTISEAKLESFHGFSEPDRFDIDSNGGWILLYIWEDIPLKLISTKMKIERLFVEINLRKKKWIICCSYNPKKSVISEHLKQIDKNLEYYLNVTISC